MPLLKPTLSPTARLAAAIVAIVAWAGLIVQFDASLRLAGGSVPAALWTMLRFFTVLANLLVAGAFLALALGNRAMATPFRLGGITLLILLVGVVYGLLLNGLLSLSGGAKLADTLLHKVTPVLVPLWWLAFAPKRGLRYAYPLAWALLPLAYFGYAIARGRIDGNYAYPFMNVARLGWEQVLLNAGAIAIGFVAVGLALVWLGKRTAGER